MDKPSKIRKEICYICDLTGDYDSDSSGEGEEGARPRYQRDWPAFGQHKDSVGEEALH